MHFLQIFEPASYPVADNVTLAYWGRQDLNTLLDHYAEKKETRDGNLCEGYIDRFICEGQFVAFKQAVAARFKGEERVNDDGEAVFHFYRPSELLQKMFGGVHTDNQQIFGGELIITLFCRLFLLSTVNFVGFFLLILSIL